MLLHLTRAAIERRDPALQRACFDCVEGCLMARNRKLILEPSYVAFWEELAFKGTRKEHLAMVDRMPRLCREFYWNLHSHVLE
jgi:hypothetical protein